MILHKYLIHIYIRNCTVYMPVLLRHYVTKAMKDHPTARIIVIGDEILKGHVKDTNSYYMCNLFYKCGVKVKKISVINDNVENIAKEIKDASDKYTYVVTCGGIGPTHDDVTYEGLAKAFNDTLHYHPKLVDIIKNHFKITDISSPAYKMAQIPQKASLKFGLDPTTGKQNIYPYIMLKNVYVFPGSPIFFKKSFHCLYKDLLCMNKKFVKQELFINVMEEAYANILSTVAKEFPNVSFGSYPVSNCRYFKTFITIESDNESDTEKATRRFCDLNPVNIFVNYDRMPHMDCITKYHNFLRNCSCHLIYEQTLEKLRQFYRNPECISIYINGSIESSIIVHLAHICRIETQSSDKLRVIYIKEGLSNDMEEFIKEMVDKYNLAVSAVEATFVKKTNELSFNVHTDLHTLLIGKIGKADKNEIDCEFNCASNASRLRVYNPLYDWTNEDVWTFASSLYLPYKSTETKWDVVRTE